MKSDFQPEEIKIVNGTHDADVINNGHTIQVNYADADSRGVATLERKIIFDINDFDETLPAPWEWDVKRFAVSFVIAGLNNRFSRKDAREGSTLRSSIPAANFRIC